MASENTVVWAYVLLVIGSLAVLAALYLFARHFNKSRWLLYAGGAAWVLVIGSVLVNALWVPSFAEVGHLTTGCYQTDALWFYVACNGFPGAGLVSAVLTLPYWLAPQVVFLAPFIAIPTWFLLVYPVAYWVGARRRGSG